MGQVASSPFLDEIARILAQASFTDARTQWVKKMFQFTPLDVTHLTMPKKLMEHNLAFWVYGAPKLVKKKIVFGCRGFKLLGYSTVYCSFF